jgi:peptidyl-prolyl cis-trans isomerase B (cyclophilin B)
MNITMQTSMGTITLELDPKKAPKTVENFVAYVKSGHFDGTIFHRVMDNFMIQGGGFNEQMVQKPANKTVENEANNGLKNDKYTIAMARTNDPHSASAQFFINVNDNDFLNFSSPTPRGWGYAVFGKVTSGQDVVDKIKKVKTRTQGFHENVPVDPVTIIKVEIAK